MPKTDFMSNFMQSYLKNSLCGIALHVVSVDDNLDDTIPYLLTDVVASYADEVEDGVYVPRIVHSILLCQDGNLQHLEEEGRTITL